jgi:hypothetical protein
MMLFAYLAKVARFLERGQARTARRACLFGVHPFLTFSNSLMYVALLLHKSLPVDVIFHAVRMQLETLCPKNMLAWTAVLAHNLGLAG